MHHMPLAGQARSHPLRSMEKGGRTNMKVYMNQGHGPWVAEEKYDESALR